jgi:hypothetical protein
LVSAAQDQEEAPLIPYPPHHRGRARSRPLGGDADHLQGVALEEADRALPRGSVPLLAEGRAHSPDSLRARYNRWLNKTPEGRELCRLWQDWVVRQIKKYEWDIDPEDTKHPTIHGLRGTGILLRRYAGFSNEQISNDVGMSLQMVEHYMRFRDQMDVAEKGAHLRLVEQTGP